MLPELTFQIMLELDIQSINNLCQTTQEMQRICQNDYFWKLKFEKDGLKFKEHHNYILLYQLEYIWRELNNQPLMGKWHQNYNRSISFNIPDLPLSVLLTIDPKNKVVGQFLTKTFYGYHREIGISKNPFFGYVVFLRYSNNEYVIPRSYTKISNPTEVYNFIALLLMHNAPYKIVD